MTLLLAVECADVFALCRDRCVLVHATTFRPTLLQDGVDNGDRGMEHLSGRQVQHGQCALLSGEEDEVFPSPGADVPVGGQVKELKIGLLEQNSKQQML